jgi:hypothetical protein
VRRANAGMKKWGNEKMGEKESPTKNTETPREERRD